MRVAARLREQGQDLHTRSADSFPCELSLNSGGVSPLGAVSCWVICLSSVETAPRLLASARGWASLVLGETECREGRSSWNRLGAGEGTLVRGLISVVSGAGGVSWQSARAVRGQRFLGALPQPLGSCPRGPLPQPVGASPRGLAQPEGALFPGCSVAATMAVGFARVGRVPGRGGGGDA